MRQALDFASIASRGGDPTTALHRRLKLAQSWAEKGTKLISECGRSLPTELVHSLAQVKKTVSLLISESRLALPEAGDDKSRADNDYFRNARQQAHYMERALESQLDAIPEYAALENSDQKWPVLGFRDQTDFETFLYPTLERLIVNEDPMQRDLFERLIEKPDFTPRELAQEGYRKDLVMDSLNALLKKKWAEWTALTLDSNAKGRLTGVGVRLLKQMLAQERPAPNITRQSRG